MAGAIGGLLAWLLPGRPEVLYESTSTILVQEGGSSIDLTASEIDLSQQLAATYKALLTTRPVLLDVSERMGGQLTAEQIRSRLRVDSVDNTRIIRVNARDGAPQMSADIANAVADTFIERTTNERLADIAKLEASAAAQGIADIGSLVAQKLNSLENLTVIERAEPPETPVGRNSTTPILLGTILGIAIGVVLALLYDRFRNVIRDTDEFQQIFGLNLLAQIPITNPPPSVTDVSPGDRTFEEGIRFLRANFRLMDDGGSPTRSVLLTSADQAAGKSTISWFLGRAVADTGKSAIVIEGDFRRPSHFMGDGNENLGDGLGAYLSNPSLRLRDVLRDTGIKGLGVVPTGKVPENFSELFDPYRLKELLGECREVADIAIIDAPPVSMVSEVSVMATSAEAVIFVARAGRTRNHEVRYALAQLQKIHANVKGFVLNGQPRGILERYYYGYSDYYGYSNVRNGSHGMAAELPRAGLEGALSKVARTFRRNDHR